MASTTAAAVGSAVEFREFMGSAAWVVRGTSGLLGPAGASDTVPGVGPALRPCVIPANTQCTHFVEPTL